MKDANKHVLRSTDIAKQAFRFIHPLGGDNSEIMMSMLGRAVGLKRAGVNLGRVPPGKEAFVYHRHHNEEEWIYILEGRALSDIEGQTEPVGAGDFVGYPAGVAHNLKNIGESDLVYLMGGEQATVEVADFPRHGKRLVRAGERIEFVDEQAIEPFVPDLVPIDKQ